jgi:hypothetical protein
MDWNKLGYTERMSGSVTTKPLYNFILIRMSKNSLHIWHWALCLKIIKMIHFIPTYIFTTIWNWKNMKYHIIFILLLVNKIHEDTDNYYSMWYPEFFQHAWGNKWFSLLPKCNWTKNKFKFFFSYTQKLYIIFSCRKLSTTES